MKHKKIKKRQITTMRRLNSLVTCIALSYASLPSLSYAQSGAGNEITNTIMSTLQVVGGAAQQTAQPQMTQAQIQQYQAFSKFTQNSTNDLQLDQQGLRKHFLFGGSCAVPPDKAVRPVGLCSGGGDPALMTKSMSIAQDYINLYDKYLRPQNTGAPVGNQCLTNAMTKVEDQARSMQAQMKKMLDEFDRVTKEMEDQQKVGMKNMKDAYSLLNGSGRGSSQDMKNTDFRKMFPKECTDALGQGQLSSVGKNKGFVGLQELFASEDESAANYRGQSLNQIKKQIESDKKKLQARIKENGMSGLQSSNLFTGIKFKGAFTKAMQDTLTPLNEDVQRANALLSEIGIKDTVPSLTDTSFGIKLDKIIDNANTRYQDNFIMDCIRGENSAAYSSPIGDVVGKFNHRVAQNQGTTIDNFKRDAKAGINGSQTMAELESAIRSVNNSKIMVTVRSNENKKVSKTLSQYFSEIKQECVSIYNGDLRPANGDDSITNFKKQSEQAKERLVKIKDKVDAVTASTTGTGQQGSIEAMVDDLIYNCSGEEIEATDCSSKSVFEKSSENFCMKKAATCSNIVNTCKVQAETFVAQKTQELKVMADQYNAQAQKLQDQANSISKMMETRMQEMALGLKNTLFPDSIPASMKQMYGIPTFTGFPAPKTKEINLAAGDKLFPGILLKGDGSVADLRKALAYNKQAIDENFNQYIQEKTQKASEIIESNIAQWEAEKAKWEEFRNNCTKTIAGMNKSAQEKYAEDTENVNKLSSERANFCRKLTGMMSTPGCGDGTFSPESLYEEAAKISNILQPDVFDALGEYRSFCTQSQNEKSEGAQEQGAEDIDMLCNRFGSQDQLKNEMANSIEESIKDFYEENELKKIKEILDDEAIKGKSDITARLKKEDIAYDSGPSNLVYKIQKYLTVRDAKEVDGKGLCDQYRDALAKVETTCSSRKDDPYTCQESGEKRAKSKFNNYASAYNALSYTGKATAWAEIGEKYAGTSCNSIASGRQFKMGQSMGENMASELDQHLNNMGLYR